MELCATANATNFRVSESSTSFKQFNAEHPVVLQFFSFKQFTITF